MPSVYRIKMTFIVLFNKHFLQIETFYNNLYVIIHKAIYFVSGFVPKSYFRV